MALPTEDLLGMPIMAAGGPYFGSGSSADGDYYTEQDLQRMAEQTNAVIDEVRPRVKIGHSKDQRLLRNSGLISDDEKPGVGAIEGFRVEGKKLLADFKNVPSKVANLVKSGAFGDLSLELKNIVSQSQPGKRFDNVVYDVALLGAKAPAVRTLKMDTLDDIAALYADVPAGLRTVTYSEQDSVWDSSTGYRWVAERIATAVNPKGKRRYTVLDVGPQHALVKERSKKGLAWIVPFTVDNEADEVSVSPADQWGVARQEWVETATAYAEKSEGSASRRAADTNQGMDELTLSEEQVRQFAEALGIEDDEPSIEDLLAKIGEQRKQFADALGIEKDEPELQEVLEKAQELKAEAEKEEEEKPEGFGIQMSEDELASLRADAKAGREAKRTLFEKERDAVIEQAVREAKIDPANRNDWKRRYEDNVELTLEIIAELKPDKDQLKVYGSDDDGLSEDDLAAEDRKYAEAASMLGMRRPHSLERNE
jgi:hypothetical protein